MSDWAIAIEKDLQWREQELASLKRSAIANRYFEVAYRSLLRALWTMLYAHYEGYTKFCWNTFLDEVHRHKIQRSLLSESLKILSLETFFSETRGDTSSVNLWGVFEEKLPTALADVATFPVKCRPSTESNLWPSVFRRESGRIGISCKELEESEARLKALVARRNEIAHGQKMTISSVEDYEPFEKAALNVMHELAIAVIDHLDQQVFLADKQQEIKPPDGTP